MGDLLEVVFVCYDDDNAHSCITWEANDTTQARYISACHVDDTFTRNHTIFMYLTPKSQLMTSKIQLPSSLDVMLLGHDWFAHG